MSNTVEGKAAVKNGIKRLVFVGISLLLQVAFILFFVTKVNENAEWVSIGTRVLAGILVLSIYSQHKTSTMKTPWIILILILPVFGTLLYLLIGLNGGTQKMKLRYEEVDKELRPYLEQDEQTMRELEAQDKGVANISRYLYKYGGYPVCRNTDIVYFDDAAKGLEAQKRELKKASKFIFMEYFAIEDAEAWHGVEAILEERARAGVDVRVFYDDMGSVGYINTDFIKKLERKGISCRVFNPFVPVLNMFLNNRDHRKMTIIDGTVGFTGGYNITNEYFNIIQPYGHWKDTGVKITGKAVNNLTVSFLEMWNAATKKDSDDKNFEQFLIGHETNTAGVGFIQPYSDSPIDGEQVGENTYISIVEQAKDYVWFVTPYLILADEMIYTLGMAAKRGVDVRVITPGIPDKKIVYSITRSYYNALIRNGVKVYEYMPGFCHCKMCVSDDKVATCGTINLDYRSLYHHFENGCMFYNCGAVSDVKNDFDATLLQCRDVTEQYATGRPARLKLWQLILRLFAPLL